MKNSAIWSVKIFLGQQCDISRPYKVRQWGWRVAGMLHMSGVLYKFAGLKQCLDEKV